MSLKKKKDLAAAEEEEDRDLKVKKNIEKMAKQRFWRFDLQICRTVLKTFRQISPRPL